MIDEQMIRYDYAVLQPNLNERGRRLYAAAQAHVLGYGGIAAVARATGLAPSTIGRGLKELASGVVATGPVRCPGGGRKKLVDHDATLLTKSAATGRASDIGRPGAAVEVGLEELRQTLGGAPGDGAQSVAADRAPAA